MQRTLERAWRVVNVPYARKSTNSNINETKTNGHAIVNGQELAETFNYHVASAGPKLATTSCEST